MFDLRRAYEPPAAEDGQRILVERLWPRGLTKARAAIDLWLKDVAPSPELRKWFAHDPAKWDAFQRKYWKELDGRTEEIAQLRAAARAGPVTLVYAARDEAHNAALALREYLSTRPRGKSNARSAPGRARKR